MTCHGLRNVIVSCRVLPDIKSAPVEIKQNPPRRAPSPVRPPPDGQCLLHLFFCVVIKDFNYYLSSSPDQILCQPPQIPQTRTSCPTSGGLGAPSEETLGPGTDNSLCSQITKHHFCLRQIQITVPRNKKCLLL